MEPDICIYESDSNTNVTNSTSCPSVAAQANKKCGGRKKKSTRRGAVGRAQQPCTRDVTPSWLTSPYDLPTDQIQFIMTAEVHHPFNYADSDNDDVVDNPTLNQNDQGDNNVGVETQVAEEPSDRVDTLVAQEQLDRVETQDAEERCIDQLTNTQRNRNNSIETFLESSSNEPTSIFANEILGECPSDRIVDNAEASTIARNVILDVRTSTALSRPSRRQCTFAPMPRMITRGSKRRFNTTGEETAGENGSNIEEGALSIPTKERKERDKCTNVDLMTVSLAASKRSLKGPTYSDDIPQRSQDTPQHESAHTTREVDLISETIRAVRALTLTSNTKSNASRVLLKNVAKHESPESSGTSSNDYGRVCATVSRGNISESATKDSPEKITEKVSVQTERVRSGELGEIREKRFSCTLCSFRTNYKGNFINHRRVHTGEKPFSCDQCSYQCNRGDNLSMHIRRHNDKKTLKITDEASEQIKCSRTGALCGSREKPFACTVCSFRSNYKTNVTRHMRVHSGEKPFSCNQCSYQCSRGSNLSKHIRRHNDKKPLEITEKGSQQFTRVRTGEAREKQLACAVCSFRCNRKRNFARHVRVHHPGPKLLSCIQCSYKCNNGLGLSNHVRRHTGPTVAVESFACSRCSFQCIGKRYFSRHALRHSNKKAFRCNQCSYLGDNARNLNVHMRKHGENPYACAECTYRDYSRYRLLRHLRRHTGEKPFACAVCSLRFTQGFNVTAHIRRMHESKTSIA